VRLRRATLVAALFVSGVAAREARADDQSQARATLDRWLDAQNSGDFAAYEALYARGFTGVKRARTRTTSFDREGWLKDRERMFQKKMKVEATNVRILAKPKTALVVFTQRWSSGKYTDVGSKQLLLRRRDVVDYEIAREELFASNADQQGGIDVGALQRFAFVLDGEVVLSTAPDEAWASGPAQQDGKVSKNFVLRSKRSVDVAKLPHELARLKGTAIHVFDGRGLRCEAKLGAFLLRGRAITADDGGFDDEGDGWAMSNHFLVAKIEGDRKACAGATWARGASLPSPAVSAASAATPDVARRAWAAFEALPESRAIQRRFDAWARSHREKATLWFRAKDSQTTVRVIRPPSGPALISVVASASEGDGDGCGGDGIVGTLWGLWAITGPDDAATLVLRNQPDEALVLDVIGAVDVDGTGRPALLFDGFRNPETTNAFGQGNDVEHGLLRALGDVYLEVAGPETPVLICPC
jgi:ketosteroid isomerase-like protein